MRCCSQTLRFLLILAIVLSSFHIHAETLSSKKLAKLEKELASQLDLYKIPGLSVAIVKDGELVLATGFGLSNIEDKTPVTKDTLFSIGSVSKPFTSILAGIRVDEDAIRWDDLIADILPDYTFSQDNKVVPLTIRDALSHRSGYGRNDALWANPETPRSKILKAAPLASPLAKYGTEFHYNNVMYLAAGLATAHDVDNNWDMLINDRLFEPLGMVNTTSDYKKALIDPELSSGYYWSDIDQTYYSLPLINTNNIAPAGGIYSTASDMAKWLLFLLNEGKVEKQQLIKAQTHNDHLLSLRL